MKTLMRYEKFITRQMLRDNPDTLFVFGDNMTRQGLGGQAKEMRGEPNVVGIPTKWAPTYAEASFFVDTDFKYVLHRIVIAFMMLFDHAAKGGKIVWPEDGIGTGLAQLNERAPRIFALIESNRKILELAHK